MVNARCRHGFVAVLVAALTSISGLFGCGGGGGGSFVPTTFYVRASGNDGNTGESPDRALRNVRTAVIRARGGDTIVVGPGVYTPPAETPDVVVEITAKTADPQRPLRIEADPMGVQTADIPGPVILDALRGAFGVRFSGSSSVVLDGFLITNTQGSNVAGIQVRSGSTDIVIRNCEITANRGDAIRIEASDRTLVFNNLIHANDNRGIQISGGGLGAEDTEIVNNTIANNGNDGISLSGDTVRDTLLRNNIVFGHATRGIDVDGASTRGYDADYNLVFPTGNAYGPLTPKGANDQSVDPQFVAGFRLAQEDAGQATTSSAVDAGDPATDPVLRSSLAARSTATDDRLDVGLPDLGAHFPSVFSPPPTPTPVFTATGVPPTAAVTPTPFPPGSQLFVRASAGDDGNTGSSPGAALRTIDRALEIAGAGTQIVVGPGTYAENVILAISGTPDRPISLRGDSSGLTTGDPPGPVRIAPPGSGQGVFVDGGRFWIVEGLTVTGGSTGIHVRRDARGTILRHNEVYGSVEDGILVQDSSDVTVFNNLVYCNGQAGIRVTGSSTGSPEAQVINNTVVANGNRGIFIGTAGTPSESGFLRNNLVQDNCRSNLQVADSSVPGFDGAYNLVAPPTYVGVEVHPTDTAYDDATMGAVDRPANFVARAFCESVCETPGRDPMEIPPQPAIELHPDDFRLSQSIAGQEPPNSEGVDAGDPTLPGELRVSLALRTTATNDEPDGGRVDIGYHFPR